MISVIYNSKVIMGNTILRRDLMITSDTFLRSHLSNIRSIDFPRNGRGRVYGLGDAL